MGYTMARDENRRHHGKGMATRKKEKKERKKKEKGVYIASTCLVSKMRNVITNSTATTKIQSQTA